MTKTFGVPIVDAAGLTQPAQKVLTRELTQRRFIDTQARRAVASIIVPPTKPRQLVTPPTAPLAKPPAPTGTRTLRQRQQEQLVHPLPAQYRDMTKQDLLAEESRNPGFINWLSSTYGPQLDAYVAKSEALAIQPAPSIAQQKAQEREDIGVKAFATEQTQAEITRAKALGEVAREEQAETARRNIQTQIELAPQTRQLRRELEPARQAFNDNVSRVIADPNAASFEDWQSYRSALKLLPQQQSAFEKERKEILEREDYTTTEQQSALELLARREALASPNVQARKDLAEERVFVENERFAKQFAARTETARVVARGKLISAVQKEVTAKSDAAEKVVKTFTDDVAKKFSRINELEDGATEADYQSALNEMFSRSLDLIDRYYTAEIRAQANQFILSRTGAGVFDPISEADKSRIASSVFESAEARFSFVLERRIALLNSVFKHDAGDKDAFKLPANFNTRLAELRQQKVEQTLKSRSK